MFARASVPWLLANELRLLWRSFGGKKGAANGKKRRFRFPPWLAAVLIVAVVSAAFVPAAISLRGVEIVPVPLLVVIIDLVIALILSLMLSQTVVSAVDAFYQRGDLDLLLSSPLSPTRILVVRALAIAVNPIMVFAGLATPFLLPAAVLGHPELLLAYGVIVAISLTATAAGLALAIVLFRLIGPRKTRTVAQILAALVGAIFVIAAQVPNIMAGDDREAFWTERIYEILNVDTLPAILQWPAEAVLGRPLPLIVILGGSIVLFTLVALWVGRHFASDAAAANSAAPAVRKRPAKTTARFGSGVIRATVVKEARLLLRDPGLISQVLLRVIYLFPLAVFIFTTGETLDGFGGVMAAGSMTLLAGQLAGSIAWITLSAEDSPELLASAPVPIRRFWNAKLVVTLLPSAILVVPVAIALAVFAPIPGLLGLLGGAAAAVSAALINLWLQKQTKRAEFRKSWSSSFAASILELATSAGWAAAAGLAVAGSIWALAAAALALAALALSYRSEATIQARLTGQEA
jgi:ABC-2 type transport system permease protein